MSIPFSKLGQITTGLTLTAIAILVANPANAQYASTVLAKNPSVYLRFSEISGTVAQDETGNGNNGVFVGGVSLGQPGLAGLTPGPNTCAELDGSSAYVSLSGLNTSSSFTPLDFSLECWINTTAASLTGTNAYEGNGLIYADQGGGANDYTLALVNNKATFFIGSTNTNITGGRDLNDGSWHHIVATRQSGNNSSVTLYVDGVMVSSQGTGIDDAILSDQSDVAIGSNTIDSRHFNGKMDEVALYSSALSIDQVRSNYFAAGRAFAPEPGSLVLLFPAASGLLALIAGSKGTCLYRRKRVNE